MVVVDGKPFDESGVRGDDKTIQVDVIPEDCEETFIFQNLFKGLGGVKVSRGHGFGWFPSGKKPGDFLRPRLGNSIVFFYIKKERGPSRF